MGMVAILSNGAKPFEQILNNPSIESPMWNLVKTGFREEDIHHENMPI